MLQPFQPRFRGSRVPALRFRNPVSGAKDHAPLPDPEPSPGNRKFYCLRPLSWIPGLIPCLFTYVFLFIPKQIEYQKNSSSSHFMKMFEKKQKHLLLTPGWLYTSELSWWLAISMNPGPVPVLVGDHLMDACFGDDHPSWITATSRIINQLKLRAKRVNLVNNRTNIRLWFFPKMSYHLKTNMFLRN